MDRVSIPHSSFLYLELLFLGALIFPPLMESARVLSNLNFNPQQEYTEIITGAVSPSVFSTIIQAIISLGMYLQFRTEKKRKSQFFLPLVFLLVFLLTNSFFWNWIAQNQGAETFQLQEIKIQNLFLMIVATSFAAFYEEIVYRWSGPKILCLILSKKNQKDGAELEKRGLPIKCIFLEAPMIIIFGLSHGYGGWMAVGNALLAGTALRLCTIRTESPFPSFFAHLTYNFIQFFLLLQ